MKKKIIVLFIFAILIVCVIVFGFLYYNKQNQQKNIEQYNAEIVSILEHIQKVDQKANMIMTSSVIGENYSSQFADAASELRDIYGEYEKIAGECDKYPELKEIRDRINKTKQTIPTSFSGNDNVDEYNSFIDKMESFAKACANLELEIVYFDGFKK